MSYPKPMKYVRLGNSGMKVSRIILGCMSYGDPEWQNWILGEKEALEHIKFAYDAGITTFDTANIYSNGKALKQNEIPREDVVIMTKIYGAVGREKTAIRDNLDELGYVNQHGLSRKHIFGSIKASLKRLDWEYIDLLQCRRFDHESPIEETMQALHDVVKAGYVRYIGMSSCWAWQFHTMQKSPQFALSRGRAGDDAYIEAFWCLLDPWSPLARGLLTRPWMNGVSKRSQTDFFLKQLPKDNGTQKIVNRVEALAKKKGVKMAQIAVAWSLAKTTAPIVGSTSLSNLQEAIDAVNIELTEEEIKHLEEPYMPVAVIGHQ